MKEINGIKRGVKLDPQPNKAQKIAELEVQLKNSQMAQQISQAMIRQLMQNMQNMESDLKKAFNVIAELQYKVLAIQDVSGLSVVDLNAKAQDMQLKDFNEASDVEDVKEALVVGDKVQDNSVVVLTSTTSTADAGIFRSRIKLADCGNPALIKAFAGASVGAKAKTVLNGVEHEIELLGIRNPAPLPTIELVTPDGQIIPTTVVVE